MADEAKDMVIISLPTDLVKPYKNARRTSSVSSNTSGSPDLQSDEEAIPRYLRPSKGSCHDFCKYGIKDINEAPPCFSKKKDIDELKERIRKPPKNLGSKKILDGENSQTDVSMILERRKKSEVVLRASELKIELKDEFGRTELPPEKIIFVSDPPMKNAKGSAEQSSSMKRSGLLHNQLSYGPSAEEPTSIKCLTPSSIKDFHRANANEAVGSSRMLLNLSDSIEDPGMTAENDDELRTDMLAIHVKDLFMEPVSVKYVISQPTLETIVSRERIEVNRSEGLSSRTVSVTENVGSGEHAEDSTAGKSADKLIEKKNKLLLRSSEQSAITKSEVNRRKTYAKQRNDNLVGANNEVSVLRLWTSSLRNSTASARSPADRSTNQDQHMETLSVEKKSTRNKATVSAAIEKNEKPANIVKVLKIMKGNKDHKPPSSSPFLKSHLSPVSSTNDRRYRRNMSPAITVKDQVKARSVGLNGEKSGDLKPKPQIIDLNAIKQKLRNSALSSPKSGEANEPSLHEKVTHSSSSLKLEEMKREIKFPSLYSDDSQPSLSHRLYLNKINVTDSQSENISPVSSKSRQAKKTITAERRSPKSTKEEKSCASDIIKTRRGRVKALVGFFETVISLQ